MVKLTFGPSTRESCVKIQKRSAWGFVRNFEDVLLVRHLETRTCLRAMEFAEERFSRPDVVLRLTGYKQDDYCWDGSLGLGCWLSVAGQADVLLHCVSIGQKWKIAYFSGRQNHYFFLNVSFYKWVVFQVERHNKQPEIVVLLFWLGSFEQFFQVHCQSSKSSFGIILRIEMSTNLMNLECSNCQNGKRGSLCI